MDQQIERMAAMSGGSRELGGKVYKYTVPFIKFNGNTGEFRKLSQNELGEKEEAPLDKPVELVVLVKRRRLSSYAPNDTWYTNEFSSKNEVVNLYRNQSGNVSMVKSGIAGELKEEYPNLKTKEIVYGLYNEEVVKMEIKGGSLAPYYDYQKMLRDDDLHGFQVTTEVGSETAKNPGGMEYHRMTFTQGKLELTMDKIEEQMTTIKEELDRVTASFNAGTVPPTPTPTPTSKPPAEASYPEEEINPDDIPF